MDWIHIQMNKENDYIQYKWTQKLIDCIHVWMNMEIDHIQSKWIQKNQT